VRQDCLPILLGGLEPSHLTAGGILPLGALGTGAMGLTLTQPLCSAWYLGSSVLCDQRATVTFNSGRWLCGWGNAWAERGPDQLPCFPRDPNSWDPGTRPGPGG
jgi:hypothetical protein